MFQCETCGKLFHSAQVLVYQRHLATHDDNSGTACTCEKCAMSVVVAQSEAVARKDPARGGGGGGRSPPRKPPAVSTGFFEKMRKNFSQEGNDDDDVEEEEEEKQFACALCASKFDSPADLENHVKLHHVGSSSSSSKTSSSELPSLLTARPMMKLTDNADRNWAAEFGYGKTIKTEGNIGGGSRPAGDLFLKMRSKFQVEEDEEEEETGGEGGEGRIIIVDEKGKEEEVEDSFKVFRARGFTGKIKASPKKVPRTLSNASMATRRRLETLIKRAREHQEKARKKGKEVAAATTKCNKENNSGGGRGRGNSKNNGSSGGGNASLDEGDDDNDDDDDDDGDDDDDDTFDGFQDEDEALLFPLANGWVMERTPAAASTANSYSSYFTSFWSPEGRQYEDVEDIKTYCKREKVQLDITVFEKAIKKMVGKGS